MAFIGTLISCYCNPDVGNGRGGGRGGPKSREKGEKNNREHVLLFKITHSWGLFGSLKTWFCMRLIGWCHFRPLTSDLSTLLPRRLCKQLQGRRTRIHLKKFTMKTLFCHPDAPRGRFFKKDVQWRMQPHSSSVSLTLKAVWRKSLLNVVPLSRSRL